MVYSATSKPCCWFSTDIVYETTGNDIRVLLHLFVKRKKNLSKCLYFLNYVLVLALLVFICILIS